VAVDAPPEVVALFDRLAVAIAKLPMTEAGDELSIKWDVDLLGGPAALEAVMRDAEKAMGSSKKGRQDAAHAHRFHRARSSMASAIALLAAAELPELSDLGQRHRDGAVFGERAEVRRMQLPVRRGSSVEVTARELIAEDLVE